MPFGIILLNEIASAVNFFCGGLHLDAVKSLLIGVLLLQMLKSIQQTGFVLRCRITANYTKQLVRPLDSAGEKRLM